jgi:membrane protein YqaA with SNARE-associated domain
MDKEILFWILTTLSGLAASFGGIVLYGLRADIKEIKEELKWKPSRVEMEKIEERIKENCMKEHDRVNKVLHTHSVSGEAGEVVHLL